jgi:hypothetical protein
LVALPHSWTRTAIQSAGELYEVVHFGSRIQFTHGDLLFLECPVETRRLTLEKALEIGTLLEAADHRKLPWNRK